MLVYLSSLYEALRYLQPAAVVRTSSQEVREDEGAVEETVLRTTTTTVVEVKKKQSHVNLRTLYWMHTLLKHFIERFN